MLGKLRLSNGLLVIVQNPTSATLLVVLLSFSLLHLLIIDIVQYIRWEFYEFRQLEGLLFLEKKFDNSSGNEEPTFSFR